MIDEKRAGKRLIVLITEQTKINTSQSKGGSGGLEGHCSYCIGVDSVGIASGGEGAVEPVTFEC